MRLKVIGTGSKGNAYLLGSAAGSILLDCGLSYKKIMQALAFRLPELFFVSHSHKDHCLAESDFRAAGVTEISRTGKRQYGHFITVPFVLEHDVENRGLLIGDTLEGRKVVYITDTAFVHNRFAGVHTFLVECNFCADILERNVWSGSVTPDLAQRIRRGHLSLDAVKDFFRANVDAKTANICLLHLSDANSDAGRIREEIQGLFPLVNVYVLESGMELKL